MKRIKAHSCVDVIVACLALSGCGGDSIPESLAVTGDPQQGRRAIREYGCGACHRIPGITGAHGVVGPPLDGMAKRAYLGGVLANTPENMVRWIRTPQLVSPKTAMPDLAVGEADAKAMAAYLYRLE
jgi:cytochrome c